MSYQKRKSAVFLGGLSDSIVVSVATEGHRNPWPCKWLCSISPSWVSVRDIFVLWKVNKDTTQKHCGYNDLWWQRKRLSPSTWDVPWIHGHNRTCFLTHYYLTFTCKHCSYRNFIDSRSILVLQDRYRYPFRKIICCIKNCLFSSYDIFCISSLYIIFCLVSRTVAMTDKEI